MFLVNLLWWKQSLRLKSISCCPVYHGHLNISFLDSSCTVRLYGISPLACGCDWCGVSALCPQAAFPEPLNAFLGFLLSPTAVCPSWHLEPPSVLQLRLCKCPSGWWGRIISCVVQAILPCRQSVQSLLFSQHHDVVDSSVNDYNHLWDLFPQTCCWDGRIPARAIFLLKLVFFYLLEEITIFKTCSPSLPKFSKL